MNTNPATPIEKQNILEEYLERMAEELGDITAPVMKKYYEQHPGARALFENHGRGDTPKLEATMVEQTLYCLMTWFDRPLEVNIVLNQTVPHHEFLEIPVDMLQGLLHAVLDVLVAGAGCGPAHSVIEEIRNSLSELIDNSSEMRHS